MRLRADRREERRREADERNKAWRAKSRSEQIESLRSRPGFSMRQLKKLGVDVE